MNKRQKQMLLHSLKIAVICGSVLYLVIGAKSIFAEGDYIEEDTNSRAIPIEVVAIEKVEPEERWNEEEKYLLAKIAMAEAEGEDTEGKALVINVVLNRVENDGFPNTIEEVIFQENQFSPIGNGRWEEVEPNEDCWEAIDMVSNEWDESHGALYFESKSKSTWHKENLEYLFQHGKHFFYANKE